MKSRVRKWGRSLAVRIPKSLADRLDLAEGIDVEMTISGGKLVVSPPRTNIDAKTWTLEELLAGVTPENRHGEWDTGRPVGKEII